MKLQDFSGRRTFVFLVTACLSLVITQATDNQAPETPAGLTAVVASSSQINLNWSPSSDRVGVTGYNVYRNGTLIATVASTSYSSVGLSPSTSYCYAVDAFDAAGNLSLKSASSCATTLCVYSLSSSSASIASRGKFVNGLGDELFTDACFSRNQDCRIRCGDLFNRTTQRCQSRQNVE